MNGRLYGVGVGPGDEELLTLKAVRVLKEADIIAVPHTSKGSAAYEVVSNLIADKEQIDFVMPMSKDIERLNKSYALIADRLECELKAGKNVAFITLGDVTVYSTYMQLNSIIKTRGYETELVAGVTSFCAAAARLNIPLCERDEPLVILPAAYEESGAMLDIRGTKVLMKPPRDLSSLKDRLKGREAYTAEHCGTPNEVYSTLDKADRLDYLSLIIVKE